jgi:type III secretion protein V
VKRPNVFEKWDMTSGIERHMDIAIGVVLIAIVGLLVLPIPAFLLDLAIAANFAFTLLLLAVAIYARSTIDLATFPSLLLLTTLFRLGLAVATTKMILLHAHAGDIVTAFGTLVAGGNVIVGLVIFVVLCVVQFVVVAKGSDRVAEVAARFTLDAIPGRQMSIDADLRAGSIDATQAKQRRDTLQREIQLYGALDGAMKFVKGDAIVGILVAVVNIVGGILIGMTMRQMSAGDAVQTYVILTVGDGLVSQIPSLIVAIAAGLLMTRGDSGGEATSGDNLGRRIFVQLTHYPRALLMAAAAAALLALVPGFPHIQFGLLSVTLLAVGLARRHRDAVVARSRQATMPNMARDGSHYVPCLLDDVEFGTAMPLHVRIGRSAFDSLSPAAFDQELGNVRRYLMQNLGLPFPGLSMSGEVGFQEHAYVVEVDAIAVVESELFPGKLVAHGDRASAQLFDVEPQAYFPGSEAAFWIAQEMADTATNAGCGVATPAQVLAAHLYSICAQHSSSFMGTQEAQFLLNRLRVAFPDLVASVTQHTSATELAALLKALLAEGIGIRNLRAICEALMAMAPAERTHLRMVQAVRIALGWQIVSVLTDPVDGTLSVAVLDEACEATLLGAIRLDDHGEARLSLRYADSQAIMQALATALARVGPATVVLTSAVLRPHVALLVKQIDAARKVVAVEEVSFDRVKPRRAVTIVLDEAAVSA